MFYNNEIFQKHRFSEELIELHSNSYERSKHENVQRKIIEAETANVIAHVRNMICKLQRKGYVSTTKIKGNVTEWNWNTNGRPHKLELFTIGRGISNILKLAD